MSCASPVCGKARSGSAVCRFLLEEISETKAGRAVVITGGTTNGRGRGLTIHGFCQRMLSLNAFESGMLFEQQLIEDESVVLSGLRRFLARSLSIRRRATSRRWCLTWKDRRRS